MRLEENRAIGMKTTTHKKKMTSQLSFQYILYVNPDKEQAIINLVHPNAKIVVQSVHKLPRPLPDFLTGTPILAEPNRSRLWRGVREVTEQLANYNEFLYFHIPEWYRAAATPLLQRFPVSADNLPMPVPAVTPVMLPPAAILPPAATPTPVALAPPPVTATPVMANSAAPVMALAPVDVSGSPNETLPPIIPPINGYRLKGAGTDATTIGASSLTPPPAAMASAPTPSPSLSPPPQPQPAFPPAAPARRFQYGTNRAPAATATT